MRGIDDLNAGRRTLEALLVAIGSPRLRKLGFALPVEDALPRSPEHALYRLLSREDERTAHSRYNALVRRLISFERAVDLEKARSARNRADSFA